MRTWVAFAILHSYDGRQFQSKQQSGSPAYSWGTITSDEMEQLFIMVCCVLPHLVDGELSALNCAAQQQDPKQPVVADPMPSIIMACGRLLTWYSNIQTPNMTFHQILHCRDEGVQVLTVLQDTFPIRNTSLKGWLEIVLHNAQPCGDADSDKPGPWNFPKSHGMASHVWATPLYAGNMQIISGQIIENLHVGVKDGARRSNGREGWDLHLMIRYARESEMTLKIWQPPAAQPITNWANDDEVRKATEDTSTLSAAAHAESQASSGAVPKSWVRAGVNATFRPGATGTALRYPVWSVMQDHARCVGHLEIPATRSDTRGRIHIRVKSPSGPNSEWIQKCPDLVHLPRFLAKYVCDRYHRTHPNLVPDPTGLL